MNNYKNMTKEQIIEQSKYGITIHNDDERETVLNAFGIMSKRQHNRLKNATTCAIFIFIIGYLVLTGEATTFVFEFISLAKMGLKEAFAHPEKFFAVAAILGSGAYLIQNILD